MNDYTELTKKLFDDIMQRLNRGLNSDLYYHCPEHTKYVFKAAVRIAKSEKLNEEDSFLLFAAVLLHDTGFLETYQNHEIKSCEYARAWLPAYHFKPEQIERVCSIIEATRIPQKPNGDKLAEILCDADLDYLGTEDFYRIGNTLFKEYLEYGIVKDEKQWNRLQVSFLESHHYFTPSVSQLRDPLKKQHLEELKRLTID